MGRRGWWLCGWFLFGGCAAEGEPGADRAPEFYCQTICGKSQQCGSASRVSACTADCLALEFPYSIEPHRLLSITRCLEGLPCNSYASGDGWDFCFQESSEAAYQSETCFEYCEGFGRHLFECGGAYVVDEEQQECVDDWGCAWSDSVLEDATTCFDVDSCEGRVECFEDAFTN